VLEKRKLIYKVRIVQEPWRRKKMKVFVWLALQECQKLLPMFALVPHLKE